MAETLRQNLDLTWGTLQWEKDPPAAAWDHALVTLSGHPLQSCLWGYARRDVDGIAQRRWLARRDGEPIWMIRIEERKVPGGKIAWAPRGPTGCTAEMSLSIPPGFKKELTAEGYSLLISDPRIKSEPSPAADFGTGHPKAQTMWVDLSLGKDILFKNLHKHVRNGVRRAAKEGVRVETTRDPERIGQFVELCRSISVKKGFDLRVRAAFINALLSRPATCKDVEGLLFVALKEGKLGAGLFILRAGQRLHLIWAGSDRDLRQDRVGEACQWGVIEWGLAHGCTRYDLERIDPVNNPSVYEFKKRLGGEEVTLHSETHTPLGFSGRAMSWLIRHDAPAMSRALMKMARRIVTFSGVSRDASRG